MGFVIYLYIGRSRISVLREYNGKYFLREGVFLKKVLNYIL